MKIISLVIGLMFLINACVHQKQRFEPPLDLIPRDSLIGALIDVMTIEAYIQGRQPQLMHYATLMERSGDSILAKHGLNYKRFSTSMEYYAKQPHVLDSIYTSVLDTFSIRIVNLPN
jgi:hypothetical protein